MNMLSETKNSNRGFTLLEMIAVLILIGIMAAVAISRFANYDAEVNAGADILKTHLRYAQTLAMNHSPTATDVPVIWGISGTANSYWLFQGTNTTNYVRLPEDERFINSDRTINLNAKKIKLTGVFTIYFDNRGIPYTAYTSATVNTPLTSAMTINVQPLNAAIPNIAVTITPLTGYIP
ncbi:MAG: Tfp pilus assembly protein FimT/FimU [Smithellaceae bacterium]